AKHVRVVDAAEELRHPIARSVIDSDAQRSTPIDLPRGDLCGGAAADGGVQVLARAEAGPRWRAQASRKAQEHGVDLGLVGGADVQQLRDVRSEGRGPV